MFDGDTSVPREEVISVRWFVNEDPVSYAPRSFPGRVPFVRVVKIEGTEEFLDFRVVLLVGGREDELNGLIHRL